MEVWARRRSFFPHSHKTSWVALSTARETAFRSRKVSFADHLRLKETVAIGYAALPFPFPFFVAAAATSKAALAWAVASAAA